MATEAEIISETRTVLKSDEEITKSISESEKPEGGLDMPVGTDECLDKANNVEFASNGVDALNTVSDSEKTSEGDEKTSKIEAIADHDSTPEEKRDSVEERGNLELKKQDSITNPNPIIDSSNEANEIVTEAGSSDLVQEKNLEEIKDTEPEKLPALEGKAEVTEATDPIIDSSNEANEIVTESGSSGLVQEKVQEKNLEEIKDTVTEKLLALEGKAEVTEATDPIIDSSNEANEIVTESGSSGLVQEETLEEIKDTETEKPPALEGKAEVTEATDSIETSVSEKDQIISDSTEDILTSKAAETSDNKDHETISEIREVAEKELQNGNPHEETAYVHEEVSKEPETDQHPIADISNSSISTKEEESIPLESTEKASSSVELEDSKKDTAVLESAQATDETEEKRQETNNVAPAEECSTEDREASAVKESEKLASEPEVKEVEETKAVPTELASKPEVKETEETKAVPTATLPSKKIEEEMHKEAEIVKHESAIQDACLLEEESEPKAISVEETINDEGLQNEEHEPKQTGAAQASITEESKEIETSALPSEEHQTTQTEEAIVEAPEVKENEIIEKQMVCDDKSVQNPSQASSTMPIVEVTEPASATSGNISLSDLLQRSEEEKTEVAERVIEESELTVSKEAAAPVEDVENIQAKEAKTDEHNKTDSGSDAPVMVEAPRDTETKPHKKSQNIVSKAISKVKKAITGKSSSSSKEPKATSPEEGDK